MQIQHNSLHTPPETSVNKNRVLQFTQKAKEVELLSIKIVKMQKNYSQINCTILTIQAHEENKIQNQDIHSNTSNF